jgi:hypothetical protein
MHTFALRLALSAAFATTAFGSATPVTTSLPKAQVGVAYDISLTFKNAEYPKTCPNGQFTEAPLGFTIYTGLGFSCEIDYMGEQYPATYQFGLHAPHPCLLAGDRSAAQLEEEQS